MPPGGAGGGGGEASLESSLAPRPGSRGGSGIVERYGIDPSCPFLPATDQVKHDQPQTRQHNPYSIPRTPNILRIFPLLPCVCFTLLLLCATNFLI